MFFPVKHPLPVITARVDFEFNKFPPPPPISLRQSHEKKICLIHRSRTPYTRPRGLPSYRRHHRQTTPFDSADEEEDSDATDEPNLTDSQESEDEHVPVAKIPKPPGEAGRKNSGGFNLQEVLGWNDDKYKNFMQWIADETTLKLSLSKPFSKQKPEAIQDLIEQGTKKFKIVGRYEMNWPIREALKGRLKNTSNRAKQKVQRQTDQKIQKVIKSGARARKKRGVEDDGGDDENDVA